MKNTCALAILWVVSGLMYCGCSDSSKPNLTELEGAWIGREVEGVQGECRMTVSGNRMKFQGARTNEWYAGSLTLNPSASPKQAVLQVEEGGFPQAVGKSARMIYKLEKSTLTIAGNEPGVEATPTEFVRSPVSRTRVFVFSKP